MPGGHEIVANAADPLAHASGNGDGETSITPPVSVPPPAQDVATATWKEVSRTPFET